MRVNFQLVEASDASDEVGPELVTLAALKTELGITSDSEDAALQARITSESKIIVEFCNRPFAYSAAIETFIFDWRSDTARRGGALSLRLTPIVAIESVTVDDTDLDASTYTFNPDSGLFWLNDSWWGRTIVVSYSGGYQLPDGAPATLAAAVIESVRLKRSAFARDPAISGLALTHGETSTNTSYFKDTAAGGVLSPSVINMIRQYRRPTVA